MKLDFETIKITADNGGFMLYAMENDNGKILAVGTRYDIAREFCKAKGILIYALPMENEQVELYANDEKFSILDYSDSENGFEIEDCYGIYFRECLKDSDYTFFGLREVEKNVSA